MAVVQVWFYAGWATGENNDSPLPKEPYIGYSKPTVTTPNVAVTVPEVATIAIIETDAVVAYRCNAPAVFANDPQIPITARNRYAIDVDDVATLNFIAS